MNAFKSEIDDLNAKDLAFIQETSKELNETLKKYGNYINKIQKAIDHYQQTGEEPDVDFSNWEDVDIDDQITSISSKQRGSLKENLNPTEDTMVESTLKKRGRPRRNAFLGASLSIRQQSNAMSNVVVKKEKNSSEDINVKVEVNEEREEMPAPTKAAPKRRRQKKSEMISIKQEKVDEEKTPLRDSDIVIVENKPITINLDSDDNEKTMKNDDENRRTTRQRKKTAKRSRTPSLDEKILENADKKLKSNLESANADVTTETHYEDAISDFGDKNDNNNATYVTEKPVNKGLPPSNAVNETVVVSNPKFPITTDDLLTDDESGDEAKKPKTPPKTITKAFSKLKQVFSPFEQSPVKKRIQAFEKLREEQHNAIPVRITRTKTKTQPTENEKEKDPKQIEPKSSKEKAKYFTPATSRFIPDACSTVLKNKVVTPSTSTESLSVNKTASSLKMSQIEYKQREKRRQQKEQEALKKREALLQAQMEERRRKNEEKQIKAQQQRELLEKEKLKALEAQKLKDERHKQLMAEQEEKKHKQREEMEKKRMMAKQRAAEEKKKEEERRLEEEKRAEEMKAKLAKQDEVMAKMVQKQKMQREKKKIIPVYLIREAPLLPTPDCFDSDDENAQQMSALAKTWDRKENIRDLEKLSLALSDFVKNAFFSRQAQTPDLQEIFEVIESHKLKRSSSAVWHKAPRFTMMPDVLEDDVFESDDE